MLNVSSAPAVGVRPSVASASESSLDKKPKMIYTHVLNRGPAAVRSPVDGL